MSKLERTWWFAALSGGVSVLCTLFVLHHAGVGAPWGFAQWTVYFFCFVGFSRCFAFLAWLTVLLARPSSPLLDTAPPRRTGA